MKTIHLNDLKIELKEGGYPDPEIYVLVNDKAFITISHAKIEEISIDALKNYVSDIYVEDDVNSKSYNVPKVSNLDFLKNTKTYQEFADELDNEGFYQVLVDESFWSQDFRSDNFLKITKIEADTRGVKLKNLEDFDYDKYFHNIYKTSEKGLS